MVGWRIRRAGVDEIERLIDLRLAMFDAMDPIDAADRERVRADCHAFFASTLPTGAFRVWVVCVSGAGTGDVPGSGEPEPRAGEASAPGEPDEGEPIASIGLVVHSVPPGPHNRVGKVGYIMNLVTRPVWRRRGIARALLEHVLGVLRAEGVPVASLHASSDGRDLYERLGFRVRDELPEMRLSFADEVGRPQ